MTTATRETIRAITAWCQAHGTPVTGRVHHVFPRAYVVGYAAAKCLVVSRPWPDAEPHMRDEMRAHPLTTIQEFDASLKAGDWCQCAYVTTRKGRYLVAIPIAERARKATAR